MITPQLSKHEQEEMSSSTFSAYICYFFKSIMIKCIYVQVSYKKFFKVG